MCKYEQPLIIIYISFDGGYSYRQTRVNEALFKKRMWETVCKWLRPDSEMSLGVYGCDIIIRNGHLSHIGSLHVSGGIDLKEIWCEINQLWEIVSEKA